MQYFYELFSGTGGGGGEEEEEEGSPEDVAEMAVYCDWWFQLPNEEDSTLMVKGDGYLDPKSSCGTEGVHIWIRQGSAAAKFLFALDSQFYRIYDQTSKYGSRIRYLPEKQQQQPELRHPQNGEEEEGQGDWVRSHVRDKKDDDELGQASQPPLNSHVIDVSDINRDVEAGAGGGGDETVSYNAEDDVPLSDYYEGEEEEEEEEEENIMIARVITDKWVIATLPEYQLYKVFLSMKATESMFFVVLEKYLKKHKNSRERVLRGAKDTLGGFINFANQTLGYHNNTPNGVHTPALNIDISQMERLSEAFRALQPNTTGVYELMSDVCGTAKRIIEHTGIRNEATMQSKEVTITYSLLRELDLKMKKFEEQASGLFRSEGDGGDDQGRSN